MTESRTNIWGLKDCEKPADVGGTELCDVCCEVQGFETTWGGQQFVKQAGVPCDLMNRQIPGREHLDGCSVHGFAPDNCQTWHCSDSPPEHQERLRRWRD